MNDNVTFHDLKNASVFITGGGSGIGAAITEGFLAQGAKVAFVQRSSCEDFLEEMSSKYNHKPLFIKCDIVDIKALKKAIPCERVAMSVIGLEVPHAHVHLIPINEMKDVTFRNKVTFSKNEFQDIANNIKSYL